MVSKTSRQPLSYKYRDHDYPDVESCGFDDFAPIRYDCGTTTVEATYYKHREGRPPLSTNEFEYVVDSVESYLDVHGVETISVPAYYSEFDEFEPVVSEWTATGRGVAKGISQRVLEGAVRLADGGGHINHDALSVTLGDDGKFLVNGERGAFLVEQVTLKERATDEIERPATEYDTVGGLLVLEGNETAREGLRRFISIFNFYTDAKLVKYEGLYDGKHVYKTDSGDNVYVNKPQRLAEAEQVLEEVAGEYTYTVDCQTFNSPLHAFEISSDPSSSVHYR